MKIKGDKQVAAQLLSMKSQTFARVLDAVEKTAVRMANHAKAGHEHGSDPHSRNRYENQTSNLTNSIFPSGGEEPMEFEEISEDRIVGLFGVSSHGPGATMMYAPYVEERYPFIWPAAVANIEYFTQQMKQAAQPRK